MTLSLHYAASSNVGLRRDGNEDSGYAGPRLLAVADGMGGHAAGEVASAVIIATLAPLDEDAPGSDLLAALREAVLKANDRLREMVAADGRLEGMGSTLSALLATGNRLGIVHVGDSRAYLLRDGEFTRITRDHTLVQTLVDQGRLAAEDADSHPQRSLLTRALDGRADVELDLSIREVRAGDRYLLCTDGLSGVVSEQTMVAEALSLAEPEDAVARLIELALRAGGPDNVTAVVADVVDRRSPGDGRPVVVGSAEAAVDGSVPSADTAAGRAALARRALQAAAKPPARAAQEPTQRPSGRRGDGRQRMFRRTALGGGVVVLLVVVAGVAAWVYLHSQYYVGTDAQRVSIFRGVQGSIAGIGLSSVTDRPGPAVGQLPAFDRQKVGDGIPASSLAEARQIVGRLHADALTSCLARQALVPQPSATASAAVTPGVSMLPTGTPTGAPTLPPNNTPSTGAVPSAVPTAPTTPTPAPSLDTGREACRTVLR